MSTIEITILSRFKTGLVQFLDELIKWMPDDEELITTRILVQDQLPIDKLMMAFIENIKPHEELIAKRKDSFFLNDPDVFSRVKNQSRVLSLKKLWQNPNFTKDDKDKAWNWMDFFVRCINLYIEHHK